MQRDDRELVEYGDDDDDDDRVHANHSLIFHYALAAGPNIMQ
jgi:hypothetical protein